MLRMQSSRLTLTRDDIEEFEGRMHHGPSRRQQYPKRQGGQTHAHPIAGTTTDHRLKTTSGYTTRLGFVVTTARPALARTFSSASSRSSEATICAEGEDDARDAQDQADDLTTADLLPADVQDLTAECTPGDCSVPSLLTPGYPEYHEERRRSPAAGSGPDTVLSLSLRRPEEATNVLLLKRVAPHNERIQSNPQRQQIAAEDIFLVAAAVHLEKSRLPIARRHMPILKAQEVPASSHSSPQRNIDFGSSSGRDDFEVLAADHVRRHRDSITLPARHDFFNSSSDVSLGSSSNDGPSRVDSPQVLKTSGRHKSWSGTQSATSSTSTSCRSMPNLRDAVLHSPQLSSKSSSPLLTSKASIKIVSHRVPSMVSAASGISRSSSSLRGLDAAEEFLRMRSSPLDELVQKFRRLSHTSYSQSSYHSANESQTSRHATLLNGDPFGLDDESDESDDELAFFRASPVQHNTPIRTENKIPFDKPLPDLPCSSTKSPTSTLRVPHHGYSDRSDLSPPVCSPTQSRSPTRMRSFHPITTITQSVRSVKAKMISLTPHVHVYNDSQPAEGQPQTPADLRAVAQYQTSPVMRGRQLADGSHRFNDSDVQSSRYRTTRHTYPASLGGLAISRPDTPGRGRAMLSPSPSVAFRTMHRRAADGLRSPTDEENVSDGALNELETERRLWLNRQGRGSLDVTPPKEGRLERFTH